MGSLLYFSASIVFSYLIWLKLDFPGDNFIGYVYTLGRPTHALFPLNTHSECFASRSQLDNALKLFFWIYCIRGRAYFVHDFIYFSSKIKKLCFPYDFAFLFCPFHDFLDKIWTLLYCHTYWFFASRTYANSFSGLFCIEFS